MKRKIDCDEVVQENQDYGRTYRYRWIKNGKTIKEIEVVDIGNLLRPCHKCLLYYGEIIELREVNISSLGIYMPNPKVCTQCGSVYFPVPGCRAGIECDCGILPHSGTCRLMDAKKQVDFERKVLKYIGQHRYIPANGQRIADAQFEEVQNG